VAGRLEAQLQSILDDPVEEVPAVSGKVPPDDANYLDPGPDPFVCGNCRFIVWGGGDFDLCQIVEDEIHASGSCRFFKHKEDARAEAIEHGPKNNGVKAHMMATSHLGGFERRG
jgi:hypothetical protein